MARCIPEPCAAPSGSCRTLGFEYVLETHPKFLIKGVVSKRTLIMHACIINVLLLTTPLIKNLGCVSNTYSKPNVLQEPLGAAHGSGMHLAIQHTALDRVTTLECIPLSSTPRWIE